MGRNALPIALVALNGRKHLSTEEVLTRLENEINIGNQNFKMPPLVKINEYASKKWKEIIKLYLDSGLEFVSTGDVGILERYCVTYGEYYWLQDVMNYINSDSSGKLDKDGNEINPLIYSFQVVDAYKLMEKINKKLDCLLQMEQHLFLTPLAKVKNIIKRDKEKNKNDPLKEMGFDNV